jgi:predicted O-methyltransferase YrrM
MHTHHKSLIIPLALTLLTWTATAQQPRPKGPPPSQGGIAFIASTLPKDDTEKKILAVLADVNATQRRGNMTVPEQDGRILRVLTESIGAKHVVEIGTSVGYSGVWFCLALRNTGGRLTTFDIDPERSAKARENFKRASVDSMVTMVLGDAHDTVRQLKEPIDLLFLDYLNKLLPLVRPGGLVVAHNMDQRMADPRYVKAITSNPALETLFLNMQTSGIAVSLKKR